MYSLLSSKLLNTTLHFWRALSCEERYGSWMPYGVQYAPVFWASQIFAKAWHF
jgi:hypothetical protein